MSLGTRHSADLRVKSVDGDADTVAVAAHWDRRPPSATRAPCARVSGSESPAPSSVDPAVQDLTGRAAIPATKGARTASASPSVQSLSKSLHLPALPPIICTADKRTTGKRTTGKRSRETSKFESTPLPLPRSIDGSFEEPRRAADADDDAEQHVPEPWSEPWSEPLSCGAAPTDAEAAAETAEAAVHWQRAANASEPTESVEPATACKTNPALALTPSLNLKRPRGARGPPKSCTLTLVRRRNEHGDYCPPRIWQLTSEQADAVVAGIPSREQELISNSALDFARALTWPQGAGSFLAAAELYAAYKEQQRAAGKEPLSCYAFSRALHSTGLCVPAKVRGLRGWRRVTGTEPVPVPEHWQVGDSGSE